MPITRDAVDAALKRVVVPALRERGFRGTYPHFHRLRGEHVDLLTFQFQMHGGSFVAELSFADSTRDNVYYRKETPVPRLRVSQTRDRHRLGAATFGKTDHWFKYDVPDASENTPVELAELVRTLLATEAEAWWLAQSGV